MNLKIEYRLSRCYRELTILQLDKIKSLADTAILILLLSFLFQKTILPKNQFFKLFDSWKKY